MTPVNPPWDEFLSRPARNAHMVHLYRDPADLRTTVSRYLSEGFHRGDSAAVIATPEHWNDFRQGLEERGHDAERMKREGRLLVLDARSTLESFMRQGMPDERLFQGAVRPALSGLAGQGTTPIRAYGEMVSLLWQDGKFEAALRLEEFWNRLAERSGFTLLCAYQGDALAPEFHGRAAEAVFQQHSQVVPTEDYEQLTRAVQQAMEEVLGKPQADGLRPLISASQRRIPVLPGAQATLLWLQSNLPDRVQPVLAIARRLTARPQES